MSFVERFAKTGVSKVTRNLADHRRYGAHSTTISLSAGTATLPGSLLPQTQAIDVTLDSAMPSSDFTVLVEVRGSGAGLLTGHTVVSHQVLDE